MGTRECIGYIEYITEKEFVEAKGYYEDKNVSFGIMFHSFVYPDEAYDEKTSNILTSNFAPITMTNGKIDFIEPKDCIIRHKLGSYKIKSFDHTNFMGVDEL